MSGSSPGQGDQVIIPRVGREPGTRLGVDYHACPVLEQNQISDHFVCCHILPELGAQERGLQLIQQV